MSRNRQARPVDGVYASLPELVAFQRLRLGPGLSGRQPPTSVLAGRRSSRLRGRGLIFEDLREYRAGDDVRRIDWRVTARTGSPHTRVFAEERERPVRLVVDQRLGMFFGSTVQMKSVTAVELASLIAWQVLAGGDRIGATVFGDRDISTLEPQRSRATVLRLLETLVRHNHALGADRDIEPSPQQLDHVLAKVAARTTHDWLIVLISDFHGFSEHTREHILRISRHNDIVAILVQDPTAIRLPTVPAAILGNTRMQLEIDLLHPPTRAALREMLWGRSNFLTRLRRELGIPCLEVDTSGDALVQFSRALGQIK